MRPAVGVVVVALLAGLPLPATAGSVSSLAPHLELDGRPLQLNGEATRRVWGFAVYDVGLYLEKPANDPQTIMQEDRGSKRVVMVMRRDVEKEHFVSTVEQSMERNINSDERQRFAAELEAFLRHLREGGDLTKGAVVTVDYVPEKGSVLGLNGRTVGVIPGADFYHMILRLWIGKPLQASIKEGLLGGKSGGR